MKDNLKNRTFSNLIWRFFERCGAQGVSFVVSIILARLLEPEVYGTIALVTVFTAVLQVFVDSGFGSALIQKKDADELDFSSVFFFNMSLCIFLYCCLYMFAPFIAKFYKNNELTAIIRVLGITLIISGVKNIQQAYVSRNLQFKKFFFATLGGTLGAAIIGIVMAYKGFGVWALVAQHLFNGAVDTIILWITVEWRPKMVFSFKRLKTLFSYGWKLFAVNIINNLCDNLSQFIIGKKYTSTELAYYNRGKQYSFFLINNINSSIDSVLFPALSKRQEDIEKIKQMTRRSIKVSTYVISPIMLGLAVVARRFVQIVLTDKWIPCVPYMQLFCLAFVLIPLSTANMNAIKAIGRTDIFLKIDILKRGISILIMLVTMHISVLAMAVGVLISNIISQMINAWPNRKLLNYGYVQQIRDVLPGFLLAIIMSAFVSILGLISINNIVLFFVQVIFGFVIYVGGSILFKNDSFYYIWNIIKQYLNLKIKKI